MKRMTIVAAILAAASTTFWLDNHADSADGPPLPPPYEGGEMIQKLLTRLPTLELKETGPQKYVFTCDYFQLDEAGALTGKERISATYTRGLPGGAIRWDDVRIARAKGFDDEFPEGEPQDYMNGFSYNAANVKDMLKENFFPGFPDVIVTKNLVWDTHMFEMFGWNHFDKLGLNEPYRLPREDLSLPGGSTFQNKQIELTWLGISKRNGRLCALVGYQAMFNKLEVIAQKTLRFKGRSHYWGTIWVSLTDKQIEYASLNEDVLLGFELPNVPGKRIVNPVRQGTFQRKR